MILNATNVAAITGGPGSGKTTLCEKLSHEGILIGSESGRAVLSRTNGHDLRKRDPLSYSLEILELDTATYHAVTAAWTEYGYDLGELPKASVEERALFAQKRLV